MKAQIFDPFRLVPKRFLRDEMRAASPNERRVMSEIWRTPGVSRSALQGQLDLTQQSIHRIVTALEQRGTLLVGPLEPPSYKGKPSPQLRLNPDFAATLGISIDTDSAGVTLMDFAGSFTTKALRIDGLSMAEALAEIDRCIEALLVQTNTPRDRLFGIGFSIAGFRVEGSRFNPPEPLLEWSKHQLEPMLADRFSLPVWAENGSNTGALCERMLGVGRSVSNFVYMSFNYGFGAGLIVDGELLTGRFGNAGEISGIFTPEEHADRPRLRSLLEMLNENGVHVRSISELSETFDMNWPGVEAWLTRVAPHASRAVNVLNSVVDPEVVVFGGQIPPKLALALIERLNFYGSPRHGVIRATPRMVPSQIKGETSAIGAATLPLKNGFF